MIKGVKLERALPSNILDIYALYKMAHKEGKLMTPAPTDKELKDYYFTLLELLADQALNYVYLARKGRMYIGFVQLRLSFRSLGPSPIMAITNLYVHPKKRKLGIGRALFQHGVDEMKKAGVNRFEFLCEDDLVAYYHKIGAKKALNFMVVE